MTNRAASPDDRIELGLRDSTLFLTEREIADYTCAPELLFKCERGVTGTYSCRCVPR